MQLPNWWEFAVLVARRVSGRRGCQSADADLPGARTQLHARVHGAKVFVVPKLFRGFDHEAMAKHLKSDLPKLAHVVVVDGEGADGFDATLLSSDERRGRPPAGEIGASPPTRWRS